MAERVLIQPSGERVRLINKEYAVQSLGYFLVRLYGGLAEVFCDESAAVSFNDVALFQDAIAAQDFAQNPSHRGFAGAWVAGEHKM